MRSQYATKAYSYQDASGKTADRRPEELVVLLFDKACSSLRRAALTRIDEVNDMVLSDRLATIEAFHKCTSKAMQIVLALREMLDMEIGGDLSARLAETYTLLAQNIWSATKAQDTADLLKICEALTELKSAWETIAERPPG